MFKEKPTLAQVRSRLKELEKAPAEFDQLERARRVELAGVLCHDAYTLFDRRSGRDAEEKVWKQAAQLLHRTLAEAYPSDFGQSFDRLRKADSAGLGTAVDFLEIDPWFFRSGYVKADLLKFICRLLIPAEYVPRLHRIVLAAIDLRDRREFRWYCKLARAVQTKELRKLVADRLSHEDPGVRRRARWVLSAMTPFI